MFNPSEHRELFVRTRRHDYAIVRVTPFPLVITLTSARNPRKKFNRVVNCRELVEEYAIVRLRDYAMVAHYPPMKHR